MAARSRRGRHRRIARGGVAWMYVVFVVVDEEVGGENGAGGGWLAK